MTTIRSRSLTFTTIILLLLASACTQPAEVATQLPKEGGSTAIPIATGATTAEPTEAEATISEISQLLFRDDFQDGDTQGWVINHSWSLKQNEGKYTFSASELGSAYVENGADWTDYRYRSGFRVNEGKLLISIALTPQGRYGLRLGGDGVFLIKEEPADTFTVLAEAGPVTTGTWHGVSFAIQGGHLQVYIDKVLWFDYTDLAPLTGGTIALGAMENSQVFVDNIVVTRITGELPAGIAQAPAPQPQGSVNNADMQEMIQALPSSAVAIGISAPSGDVPASGGAPDLVIVGADFLPNPVKGEVFSANFSAMNAGNASAGAFTLLLHFHAFAGISDCSVVVGGLAPGEYVEGQCDRVIIGNTGNYPVEVTADSGYTVVESSESNNMIVTMLTLIEGAAIPTDPPVVIQAPDLTVTGIAYDQDINGIPFYRCSFLNNGTAATGSSIFLQVQLDGSLYQEVNVSALESGQSDSWLFGVTNSRPFTLTCVADANGVISESNEGNNVAAVAFP